MSFELIVITRIIYVLGSICGLLFLFFRMRDAFQQANDREDARNWFARVWKSIEILDFYSLPTRIIKWTINKKEKLVNRLEGISEKITNVIITENNGVLILASYLIICSISVYQEKGKSYFFWVFLIITIITIIILIINRYNLFNIKEWSFHNHIENSGLLLSFLLCLIGLFFILNLIISKHLGLTFLILTLLIPILAVFINLTIALSSIPLNKVVDLDVMEDNLSAFGIATSISFSITMIALLFGNLISPLTPIPSSSQLLIINVLFDGLTLIITFELLKWSIKKNSVFRIPIAILIDLFLAGIFGCSALYLGLINSEFSLSFNESINILFAKSKDGIHWELGPYFWVMHTTFIPTLIYLVFIVLAVISKYITIPVVRFLKGVSVSEKPYYATATSFGFIGALLLAIVKSIEWFYS